MEFQVGQRIEVIGKDEGFERSYCSVKVISKESGNKYTVEYSTLWKDDESGPLQEVVAVDQFCPEPPNIANVAFSLEEVVDAYYNDGWCIGLIEGKFDSKYFVPFPNAQGEEVLFIIDKLRIYLEWSNGKWRPSSTYKKRIKNTSNYPAGHGQGCYN